MKEGIFFMIIFCIIGLICAFLEFNTLKLLVIGIMWGMVIQKVIE